MQFIDEPCAQILLNGCDTAADSYVPLFCSVLRTLQCGMDSVSDEVKHCVALHFKRRARIMCENKRRDMIRRLLAPPSLPRVIWPRTTHRAERVPRESMCRRSPFLVAPSHRR